MRQPHPNTHLVETVIKTLQKDGDHVGGITVGLICDRFTKDYPQAEIPSPRTSATIKKRLETPEAPPSNLCKACMGYGYLFEQTKTYFGDGTVHTDMGAYTEIACHICENSGIDPNWQRPITRLLAKMGGTSSEAKIKEIISSIPTANNQGTQDYEEPLERTL